MHSSQLLFVFSLLVGSINRIQGQDTGTIDPKTMASIAPNLAQALDALDVAFNNIKGYRGFGSVQKIYKTKFFPTIQPFQELVGNTTGWIAVPNSTELLKLDEGFSKVYDKFKEMHEKMSVSSAHKPKDDLRLAMDGHMYPLILMPLTNIRRPHIDLIQYYKGQPLEYVNNRNPSQIITDTMYRNSKWVLLLTPCVENRTDAFFKWLAENVTLSSNKSSTVTPFFSTLLSALGNDLRRFAVAVKILVLDAIEALIYSEICLATRFTGPGNETKRAGEAAPLEKEVEELIKEVQKFKAKFMYTFHETQLDKDVKQLLFDTERKSAKEIGDNIHKYLSLKYDWFQWGVIIYNPITGDGCHMHKNATLAKYALFNFAERNVVITWNHKDELCQPNCTIKEFRDQNHQVLKASPNCNIEQTKSSCSSVPAKNVNEYLAKNVNVANLLLTIDPECDSKAYVTGDVVQHVSHLCYGRYNRVQCNDKTCDSACKAAYYHGFHAPVALAYAKLPSGEPTAYEETRAGCCPCEKERKLNIEDRSDEGLANC